MGTIHTLRLDSDEICQILEASDVGLIAGENASTELRLVAVFRALRITGWRRIQPALARAAHPATFTT